MNTLKSLLSSLSLFVIILVINVLLPVGKATAQEVPSLPGQFVYVEDDTRLYLVRGNVDQPALLVQTEGNLVVENPHFSRDGRYLAYCIHDPSAEDDIRLYYLDTLTLEKVEVTTEGSCSYDWWQDGKTLVFSTTSSPSPAMTLDQGIWSYTLETGALEVLIRTEVPVTDPRWSADGRTLSYFDYCFECVGQFHTYDLITDVTMDWSQEGSERAVGPDVDWSPDGKSLVFDQALWISTAEGETHSLALASSDGETWKEIYSQPGRGAYFPVWSPDGKRIAFASFESFTIGNYVNRRADLVTVSPDGSNAKNIYSSIYEVFPQAWSPDGRYMLIVEPLSVSQDSIQKQQLVLVDMGTGSSLWRMPSLGTLTADWAPIPAGSDSSGRPIPAMAGRSGILFISPDYALAFYEPATGELQKLTASFQGKDFSVAPDGRTVLFGDQIISMQSQADGTVSTSTVDIELPNEFDRLRWSPDGQRFGYVDEDGAAWIVDLVGNRQQLTDGSSPPEWSYDGQWMAFCDKDGRLWIAKTGKPADWIIQQVNCAVSWSPTQVILAYITFPSQGAANPADGTAFLYDPISGSTKEITQAMSGLEWSTDGTLLSIQRVTTLSLSNYIYTVTVVNPESGAELFIDEYNSVTYANKTWIEQADGYLFGRYRFQADLTAKEPAADILFDATRAGGRLLAGSGGPEALEVVCKDVEANTNYPLLNVTLNDTPGIALPGLHGEFSPDGNWIFIGDYVEDRTINWLAQCDGSAPVQLPKNIWFLDQYFSPDSAWLVMEDTHPSREMIPQIFLQELASGTFREVQAGWNIESVWFHMPDAPVIPTAKEPVVPSQAVGATPINEDNSGPINLQSDLLVVNDRVVLFSIILWASALIAIVILMLYLWRYAPTSRKQPITSAPELSVESKPVTIPELAVQFTPEEVKTAFQQGVDHVHAGRVEEGILELRKVITVEPENDVAWFWLGIASVRQKDTRTAERCFLQAKRHGHPEADKALEWLKKQKI